MPAMFAGGYRESARRCMVFAQAMQSEMETIVTFISPWQMTTNVFEEKCINILP
jgi:hypothetical protein